MGFVSALRCRECSREYPVEPIYVCEFCFGPLEVVYDYEGAGRSLTRRSIAGRAKNLWRYRELLPVDGEPAVGLNSGFTPLLKADNLARALGVRELYIKDDTVMHPTLSFKDRVVSVALTKAMEFWFKTVACASTGNLAHSVSALGARSGLERFVFIPASLEQSKIAASIVYSPHLIAVDGNYDDVNRLCAELASEELTWAFVNLNVRPYYAEGSKTLAFEVAEQLGWIAPDHVVVPIASGSQLTKIQKGFSELAKVGLLDGDPNVRISGAQAKGCAPVANAFASGADHIRPVKPDTIAKSLAIGNPADGEYALEAVRSSGGAIESVTDDEIIEGIKLLASTEGVFAETAGGVTIACLAKLAASNVIKSDEKVVAFVTGHGLKTVEALAPTSGPTITIEATLEAFEKAIANEKRG